MEKIKIFNFFNLIKSNFLILINITKLNLLMLYWLIDINKLLLIKWKKPNSKKISTTLPIDLK